MPNRILKESICTSETLDKLSWFEEVFWYRLIVTCDDFGRMDARIPILKSRMFPLKPGVTNKAVELALKKLSTVGLVALYEFEGRPYLQLVTWRKHQQKRANNSKYPDPDINCNQMISDDIRCNQMISGDIKCPREYENTRNENTRIENTPLTPLEGEGASVQQQRFEQFWKEYPKKVAKQYALKAWMRIKPDKALFEKMLKALREQKQSEQWRRDNGKYIPNPATWLNGGYWDNEPEQPSRPGIQKQTSAHQYDERSDTDYSGVIIDLSAFDEKEEAKT